MAEESPQRYSINLKGECELDPHGGIFGVEWCQGWADEARANGEVFDSEFDRYVAIEAMTYDPDRFVELAPSDQRAYLKSRYGLQVPVDVDVGDLGIAILSDDYFHLYESYREYILPYLQERLDDFDFFLMNMLLETTTAKTRPASINLTKYRLELHRQAKQIIALVGDELETASIYNLFATAYVGVGIVSRVAIANIGRLLENEEKEDYLYSYWTGAPKDRMPPLEAE